MAAWRKQTQGRRIAAGAFSLAWITLAVLLYWPGSAFATPTCFGKPDTIRGLPYDPDVIVGTPGNDVISTFAGDDVVYGMGGNDLICTGSGNDTVIGGAGDDQIEADTGNDTLIGDYSDINVDGNVDNQASGTVDGADFIRGGSENDLVVGDSLDTGHGDVSGNGSDTLQSGSGNDTEVG